MRLAALVIVIMLAGAAAHADDPPPPPRVEHFGFELRTGAELPRDYPTVGAYLSVGVGGPWSVGAGYEGVRTFGVTVPKSCETIVNPVIVSSLRAGAWRRIPLRHGFALRAGLLLGVAAPSLSPGPFPSDSGGAAGEAAIDLAASWSWKALDLAVYAQPSFAAGSLHTSQVCPGMDNRATVTEAGMQIGFGLAVRL
jgi:hypothetical protein